MAGLYCSLLEAAFEVDAPAEVAEDAPQVLALLEAAWGALRLGPRAHELALLTSTFAHYQHAAAPQLLVCVGEAEPLRYPCRGVCALVRICKRIRTRLQFRRSCV